MGAALAGELVAGAIIALMLTGGRMLEDLAGAVRAAPRVLCPPGRRAPVRGRGAVGLYAVPLSHFAQEEGFHVLAAVDDGPGNVGLKTLREEPFDACSQGHDSGRVGGRPRPAVTGPGRSSEEMMT
ncbi:hypothetical protein [Nocardiopsis metallicus]|uniref:Uncharacterized protein n=1 Tax=Nocardiopsis metallicus TaxID=179819 RepID=A0A840WCQ8_9ACTN|nr:hypothetical protein [Nocardiopsis metallicus]MBB5493924.1 hypothetical protein [Nocardiopsis metallicus]